MSTTRPGDAIDSEVLDAVFSALSHPARRRMLVVLHVRGGVMSAGEINDRFKHSWPTTTRHLGVLVAAGLVEVEKQGRRRLYSLRRTDLQRACSWLGSWADIPDAGARDRGAWAGLPYATMRNAIPPSREGDD